MEEATTSDNNGWETIETIETTNSENQPLTLTSGISKKKKMIKIKPIKTKLINKRTSI
jgi:hypothetical protein